MLKLCVILYLGLGGGTFGQGLYDLAKDIKTSMPGSRVTVVEFFQDSHFASECQKKAVVGHSLGAGAALRKAEREHVDLVITYDGMGIVPPGKRYARTVDVRAANPAHVAPFKPDLVVRSQAGHIGVSSDPKVRAVTLRELRRLRGE